MFNSPLENVEIGRVLRASTAGFAIGSRVNQLSLPSFGSLVKAQPVEEREAIYGLIYDIHIDDDPLVRRLVLADEPRQSVIEDQRSNRLLPIEMSVLSVGYRQNRQIAHGLPPRPPLNLDPVFLVQEQDEVCQFTDKPGYLRMILRNVGVGQVPVDQLLVAHINHCYEQRGQDKAWAMRTIEELIELLRSNYDLLIPTLEAISDALPEFERVELLT
jgi:hypothetical protein